MTKRERMIATGIGVVVALLAAQYLLKSIFLAPLDEKDKDIARIQSEITKTQTILDRKNRLIGAWRSFSKRTLSEDPATASQLLNERVTALTAGLQNVSRTTITDLPRKTPNGQISYYPVAINISGRGTLRQIVEFLEKFAREPYNVKITGFTLNSESKSDVLGFSNCKIETIIPAKPALAGNIMPASRPAGPLPAVQGPPASEYRLVWDRNILRAFVPPAPVVQAPLPTPVPTPPPVVYTPPQTIGPADPNGRPGDVVATTVIGAQGAAYIRNQNGVDLYKISDRWQNRLTMTFVNPLGVVLKDPQGKLVYVEIGRNLDQAAPLTPDSLPELYQAYRQTGDGK